MVKSWSSAVTSMVHDLFSQKIESASSEEKQMILDEIVPDNTLQLVQDVFGNYVCRSHPHITLVS